MQEKFDATKEVIRSHKFKGRQYNGQKIDEGQTVIYETLHRKLKIEQHEPHQKRVWTQMLWKSKHFLLHYLYTQSLLFILHDI